MKKPILLFAIISSLCFLSKISYAQAPDWLWAKSAGGTSSDCAAYVAVDTSGNTYVVGDFTSSTITFGSTTLTNADNTGYTYDIFIVKYDANGNLLWAKSAGGWNDDGVVSVAVDVSGNIYFAGWFQSSTIIFGFTTLTNAGHADIFLAKYDVNGDVIWAKSAGGTGWEDWANSVAVDSSGNTYVVGSFSSHTLSFGFNTLTNTDSIGTTSDLFLAKYDTYGNVLWAKSAGGTSDDLANSVAVDSSGNTYLAGRFRSPTITFGSTTLTNAGVNHADIFLAKYDANGNVLWAKSSGGTGNDWANSVAVDASGNTYLTGVFISPTITFGSTTLTNASYNSQDMFLAKYDTSGYVLWAKSAGGTYDDEAFSITVDASGNIYLAGYFFSSTITFGFTVLTNADNTGNTSDMFLTKLSASTGINELSNLLNISIFPNPAIDNLTIKVPQKATIEILNIEGQIMKSISAGENHTTIDISGFASGMYFVEVKTDEGIVVKKFVKE
ncbi:MAG: SBBP repeat-containing protein [Bacteroidales bacterium]